MPGKVKVKILAGRNLPIMDRSSETTDAYVEIKLGATTYKTDVCRKSLHPQWNSEWYKFELDDSELQDEPLQMRLMDHDTYSANDAIGKVYLDLNPLLLSPNGIKYWNNESNSHENVTNSVMSGWLPVFDTMHGIRGEVNVIVKVELFSDSNRYRQSSCGVQFFCSSAIPSGFYAETIHGFVEELIVSDDPEYQWIDKIRTPRASNEARQTLFFKLSGELQRKIGVKTLELGANAVLGFKQHFDLEGDSGGIVARGIGTAVTLAKLIDADVFPETIPDDECANSVCQDRKDQNLDAKTSPTVNESDCKGINNYIDLYSKPRIMLRSRIHPDNLDLLEYPFLTMSKYPSHSIIHLGGAVSARSVKLLDRISNVEEPETRDSWWSELRLEIRSHSRSLNCNTILGYLETASVCGDICVLSASGTAAIIGENPIEIDMNKLSVSQEKNEIEKEKVEIKLQNGSPCIEKNFKLASLSCTICHLPLNGGISIKSPTLKCGMCGMSSVPDILISTIEVPDSIPIMGKGCLLQTSVCRPLRDLHGESHAKEISDGLPFLEYELHRLLINKLKVKGMNAIFGLEIKISIGERMLIGIAAGTAVYLIPLPRPITPKLVCDRTIEEKKLIEMQKMLNQTVKRNREIYQLKAIDEPDEESDEDTTPLDIIKDTKDYCVLELDDPNDIEIMNLIKEGCAPEGFHVVNTEYVPGLEELEIVKNLQMFKQIHRSKIQPPFNLDHHFQKLLHCVYFKLRRMIPCAICDLQFRVDLPEPDEIQLTVLGMALGLGDPPKTKINGITLFAKNDELIFNFEEDHSGEMTPVLATPGGKSKIKRNKSPLKNRRNINQRHTPHRERPGVDITPLSYIPGGKIEKYLGNLNFFLIRESTSIREEGGLSGFLHSFITEVLAIVRAHVTALGGNAMVGYFLTECVLNYNLHKNQGQCLINVGGDVVNVSYYNGDQ